MRKLPRDAQRLFESQHGVASRWQLLTLAGMTEGEAEGLVNRRVLMVVHRGVYRCQGSPLTPKGAAMAALLRSHAKARVSGPLVLGLLTVDGFSVEDPFEILLPPGRRVRNVPFATRLDPSPDSLTARIGALRIPSPARLLIDAARPTFAVSERRLLVGYDSARWKGLLDTDRFEQELAALGNRDLGVRRWSRLTTTADRRAESPPERVLGALMQRFDPAPEPQVWVTRKRRADWYWRILRLAIEYLGEVDHGTPDGRAVDRVRSDELASVGVEEVGVVAADLRDRDAFVAWMADIARRRAHQLGVPVPQLRAA